MDNVTTKITVPSLSDAKVADRNSDSNLSGGEPKKQQKTTKAKLMIDFEKMLDKYKARTEKNVPCTQSLTDDVMFINQKHLVSLEYVFYQNDKKTFYSHLVIPEKKQCHNILGKFSGRNKMYFSEKPFVMQD